MPDRVLMDNDVVLKTCCYDAVDEVLYIPEAHPFLMPIIAAIPLQLLAYYAGTVRGYDVDRPRNLAKSLTVD